MVHKYQASWQTIPGLVGSHHLATIWDWLPVCVEELNAVITTDCAAAMQDKGNMMQHPQLGIRRAGSQSAAISPALEAPQDKCPC